MVLYFWEIAALTHYFNDESCNANVGIVINQRTNDPLNAHLICWPSKAQDIQSMENIW